VAGVIKMLRILWKGLAGSGLLLMALSSQAQVRDRDDQYYRGGDYQNRDYRERGRSPMDRAMYDLNRAESDSRFVGGGDRRRIEKAREEISRFERRASEGRYDRHELDRAIASVQRVVDSNALNYRDRAALIDDLARMREFRSGSNGYGGYGFRPRW